MLAGDLGLFIGQHRRRARGKTESAEPSRTEAGLTEPIGVGFSVSEVLEEGGGRLFGDGSILGSHERLGEERVALANKAKKEARKSAIKVLRITEES